MKRKKEQQKIIIIIIMRNPKYKKIKSKTSRKFLEKQEKEKYIGLFHILAQEKERIRNY